MISADGAAAADTVAEPGAILPQFLPGGRALLFTRTDFGFGDAAGFRVEWLSLMTRERKVLITDAADARLTPNGYLIFGRQGAVLGVPFDPSDPRITRAPFTVLDNVMQSLNGGWSFDRTGAMQLAFSPLGQLAWLEGGITPDADGELSWLDRRGRRTPIRVGNVRGNVSVRLSPDESKAAITRTGTQLGLTIVDLKHLTSHTITPTRPVWWPLWSPDGARVLAGTTFGDRGGMAWFQVDDSRPVERLPGNTPAMYPAFWSPDGSEFVAHRGPLGDSTSSSALRAVKMSSGTVRDIANLPSSVLSPALSPDGRWLAYVSIFGQDTALYLQPWPSLDRRWKVAEPGTSPAWTRDGRELVFTIAAGADSAGGRMQRMMAVEIRDGTDPTASEPRELFIARMEQSLPLRGYDVSGDGSRFYVMSRSRRPSPPGALNVIVGWFDELRRLAEARAGRQ